MRAKKKLSHKRAVVIRNMPEFHTLYGSDMPTFGKNHGNEKVRTVEGLRGFFTKNGHFIDRAWGEAGAAICGATVLFSEDPIVTNGSHSPMAACCRNRLQRIRRRLQASNNP
ncbi:MAG: hypothetical protein M0Z67_02455 [Nitrospiraceae bacterium]|nr:hypothetical protein [Nitrospiraceae bacterium]